MIQAIKSNPIPRTLIVALGPAFTELKIRLGLLLNKPPLKMRYKLPSCIGSIDLKACRISDSGKNKQSPLKGPTIVLISVGENLGLVALKKDSIVNNNLKKIRSVRRKEPELKPCFTVTILSLIAKGNILGIPWKLVRFNLRFLCVATQVFESFKCLFRTSTLQITSRKTSDQYLMVKVIPDFSHIMIINPVIFRNEVESLGLNPSLLKMFVTALMYLGISLRDIHSKWAIGWLLNSLWGSNNSQKRGSTIERTMIHQGITGLFNNNKIDVVTYKCILNDKNF
jgi:hypothetical protein